MVPFISQAREYAEYHQKIHTHYFHNISTLLLYLAFLIFLGFMHVVMPGVFAISIADLFLIGLTLYYLRLNWLVALAVIPIFIVLSFIAYLISNAGPNAFSVWTMVILLVLGIILHIAGYLIEGKYPSVVSVFRHILIAPLCITAEIFFMAGKLPDLKEQIHGNMHLTETFERTN